MLVCPQFFIRTIPLIGLLEVRTLSTKDNKQTQINEEIRASEVRLIDENGEMVGIVSIDEALSKADKLILLDIYPAREEPIAGVTSEIIFKDVTCPEKVLLRRSELMDYLDNEPLELLVTLGAGDIDRFVGDIAQMLRERR